MANQHDERYAMVLQAFFVRNYAQLCTCQRRANRGESLLPYPRFHVPRMK